MKKLAGILLVVALQTSSVALASAMVAPENAVDGTGLPSEVAELRSAIETLTQQSGAEHGAFADQLDGLSVMSFQLEIEDHLITAAREGNIRSVPRVLVLPQSMGGMLEVVRDVVELAIENAQILGWPTNGAAMYFHRAEVYILLQDYKMAYLNFAWAYRDCM